MSIVNTTEHVFAYDRSEHAVVYKPLCLDLSDGTAFTINGEMECSSMNLSPHWIHTHCEPRRWLVQKDLEIYVEKWNWTRQWLQDNDKNIRWVDDLTVLMVLDRGSGNIAHFCGRVLLLFHMLQNLEVYLEGPHRVTNIVIAANRIVMPWLNGWKKGSQWYKHLLNAVVAPTRSIVSDFKDFLDREADFNGDNRIVHIVPSLRTETADSDQKYVGFKQAIVPGISKGGSSSIIPSTHPQRHRSKTKKFRASFMCHATAFGYAKC